MLAAMTAAADPKTMIAGIFDRGAATYDSVGVDFFGPMGRDLVGHAALAAGERVLDLGCGRGAVLMAARAAVGDSGSVAGIDLAAGMVELTRADVERAGWRNVSVVVGDAEDPPFEPGSFDAILLGLVIFFIPDPVAALRRYAGLLGPGGRVAFSTFGPSDPTFDAAMKALGSFVPGPLPDRAGRQGPFTSPQTIVQLLVETGYREIETVERTYESRFRDAEHWLRWVWSHGGRAVLERVPAEAMDAATEAAFAALEPARAEDGGFVLHSPIRLTRGQV